MGEKDLQNVTPQDETNSEEKSIYPFDDKEFTPVQIQAIVKLSEFPPSFKNFTELAEQLEVSRQTVYEWRNNSKIQDAINELSKIFFKNAGQIVRTGHLKACAKGNPQAIKLYYQKAENWVEKVKVDKDVNLKGRHFIIEEVSESEDDLTAKDEIPENGDVHAEDREGGGSHIDEVS